MDNSRWLFSSTTEEAIAVQHLMASKVIREDAFAANAYRKLVQKNN